MDKLDTLAEALFDHTVNTKRAYARDWDFAEVDEQEEYRETARIVLRGIVDDPDTSVDTRRMIDLMIGDSAAVTKVKEDSRQRAGMTDEEWEAKHRWKDRGTE